MPTFTAPSLRLNRRAASAWDIDGASPMSHGLSVSNCSALPAAANSFSSTASARPRRNTPLAVDDLDRPPHAHWDTASDWGFDTDQHP